MYISDIQRGIQTHHMFGNMLVDATDRSRDECYVMDQVVDWARNHQTIVILNGGDESRLSNLLSLFQTQDNFPIGAFREPALGNALTSVGIILPERIYSVSDAIRMNPNEPSGQFIPDEFHPFEVELAMTIAASRLA